MHGQQNVKKKYIKLYQFYIPGK